MTQHDDFWSKYYRDVFDKRLSWLDYSNERVQAQTFGLTLEAAGPVRGRKCLDIGCGWGQLARTLHAQGAAQVTGVDVVAEPIAEMSRDFPQITWLCGDVAKGELHLPKGGLDLVLMIEVLQYMPLSATLSYVWDLIAPGGRLVAVAPNAHCPIVASTRERFGGKYAAIAVDDVGDVCAGLKDLASWKCRGLFFADEQLIAPYETSAWSQSPQWARQPNRLQFAAIKSPG